MIYFGKEVIRHGGRARAIRGDVFNGKGCGNVSIAEHNGKLLVSYRVCDYTFIGYRNKVTYDSRYMWTPSINEFDVRFGSENVIGELDTDTLDVLHQTQYLENQDFGKYVWTGYEDVRIVSWDGRLFASASKPYHYEDQRIPMCIAEIDDKTFEIVGEPFHACIGECEKNWMPLVDIPYTYVYSTKPLQVVRVPALEDPSKKEVECLLNKEVENEFYKGSTQVVSYKGHYIAMVHYNDRVVVNGMGEYRYYSRFIVWDENWNVVRMSEPFTFAGMSIEFACGLCLHNDVVYVTFSVYDNAAFVLEMPVKFFDWFTGFGEEPVVFEAYHSSENDFLLNCDKDREIIRMADFLHGNGNIQGSVSLYSDAAVKTESKMLAEYAYMKVLTSIKDIKLPTSDIDYTIKLIAEDRVVDQLRNIV